jgi:hypothetical protein
MEPDLLGYLLNILDDDERRAVEQHLESHAASRRHLVALRRLLQPLADDADVPNEPSNQLLFNTLRAIAGLRGREQVRQATSSPRIHRLPPPVAPSRPVRWRRADVLVAASIALFVLLLVPPAVLQVRHRQEIVACADNLRQFHEAFQQYASDRNGELPTPSPDEPMGNNAGIYTTKLREAGYWSGTMRVTCPANQRAGRPLLVPPSVAEVCRHRDACPEEYEKCLRMMGGCYAYNLGYVENGKYVPVRRDFGEETPIMSDRPYRSSERPNWQTLNSPNHGERGQNVLFIGGHVRFVTTREVNNDDLFLNKDGRLAPGRGVHDVVLAPSEVKARVEPALGAEGD